MWEEFHAFRDRVNLIFVLDHAGRAGNGFFQTIFDQHPEVIACPWMHYVYSYIVTEFGEQDRLDVQQVREQWCDTVYFSLLYNDLNSTRRQLIRKMGGDDNAEIDRAMVRTIFDGLILDRKEISRKEFVAIIFFSFAQGLGRDTETIRFMMCPDSISLRYESAITGFSGKIIDLVLRDYPKARLIHLERDPRAGFASANHQFVNQLGNMYGLKFGNFWSRIGRLVRCDFDWDSVFVFGFWLIYFRQTYKTIMSKRSQYKGKFLTVRNEDLNLSFEPTMKKLAKELGVKVLGSWNQNFQPTMLGRPWTGTGAYNSQYQSHVYGPLQNDPDGLARQTTGPNIYVTERWKSRLRPSEIFILEALFAPEISYFGYKFESWSGTKKDKKRVIFEIWRPLKGELPTLGWVLKGRFVSIRDFFDRIFYVLVFPVFYICSRMVFVGIVKQNRIFMLDESHENKQIC